MATEIVDSDYLNKKEFEHPIYPKDLKAITDALQNIMARLIIIEERIGVQFMIMNVGIDLVRDWLAGDAVNDPTHMAVGVGTSNPIATETTLESELLRKVFSAKTKEGDGKITYEISTSSQVVSIRDYLKLKFGVKAIA